MTSDEIDQIILLFITENRGKATKNDVVHHMDKNGILSRVPTLNRLKELNSSGKIIVLGGKNIRRGQAHLLTINNQNAYNRIYNWLTELDIILNQIQEPLSDMQYYICGPAPDDPNFHPGLNEKRSEYLENLRIACHMPIERFLDFLFVLINRLILAERDLQLLNERIVELYLKTRRVFLYMNSFDDIDPYFKNDISELDHALKDEQLAQYMNATEIDPKFVYNLRQMIAKFRTQLIENFNQH